jgi:pimeloyl-ACP methyl ester carboxylesterase
MKKDSNSLHFTFAPVDKNTEAIILHWLNQKHVQEWIHGPCLQRTLEDIKAILQGSSLFQHWIAYDGITPVGYLLTSQVTKDPNDEYGQFCTTQGPAITLDVLIGNPQYLGKGLAHRMIQEFLLNQCSDAQEVLIDPEMANHRAIHVYEKAGFSVVTKFTPSHNPVPHYLMRLSMDNLKQAAELPRHQFIQHNGLQLWCETLGHPLNPAVVLIAGAGAHAHFWTDQFCHALTEAGHYVIRFDHRDCCLSSAVDFTNTPYSVADLAEDVTAIMDAFHIKKAHAVGHSMGGTIAQLLAILHPERLLSFTSISVAPIGNVSTVSDETMATLLENKPTQNFEKSLEGFMRSWSLLNGEFPLDIQMAEEYTRELYTRSIHPVGVAWNHIHCQERMPPIPNRLSEMPVRGLFLYGSKDCLCPPQPHWRYDTQRLTTTIIPKMGHMMFHKELQQQIAHILLAHFAQSEKRNATHE